MANIFGTFGAGNICGNAGDNTRFKGAGDAYLYGGSGNNTQGGARFTTPDNGGEEDDRGSGR